MPSFQHIKQSDHDCRAKSQTCNRCSLVGHFACSKLCKKKKKQPQGKSTAVNLASSSEEEPQEVKRVSKKKFGSIRKIQKPETDSDSEPKLLR